MREEADEKNKDLTAEEKRRNVKWMVVGRRGEKRLIKGVEREQQYRDERNYNNRSTEHRSEQNRSQRPVVPQPGILPDRRPRPVIDGNHWPGTSASKGQEAEATVKDEKRRDVTSAS
jgi:hypothetical protein